MVAKNVPYRYKTFKLARLLQRSLVDLNLMQGSLATRHCTELRSQREFCTFAKHGQCRPNKGTVLNYLELVGLVRYIYYWVQDQLQQLKLFQENDFLMIFLKPLIIVPCEFLLLSILFLHVTWFIKAKFSIVHIFD